MAFVVIVKVNEKYLVFIKFIHEQADFDYQ